MAQKTSPQPAKQSAAKAYNLFNLVNFTIGAKAANTINVALQLQDARGQNIAQIAHAEFYLSANADGSTFTGTATTSALAVHTNGVLLDILVTGKMASFITNASGQVDFDIIQTASPVTYYLAVMMEDGSIIVSPAITF